MASMKELLEAKSGSASDQLHAFHTEQALNASEVARGHAKAAEIHKHKNPEISAHHHALRHAMETVASHHYEIANKWGAS